MFRILLILISLNYFVFSSEVVNPFSTTAAQEAIIIQSQKDSSIQFAPTNVKNKVSQLPTARELSRPIGIVYDVTKDPIIAQINISKIILEVAKITAQIDKIISEFPRESQVNTCLGTGCPIDSVQCDATYQDPLCPNGTLNTTTHMCETNPTDSICPDGYLVDTINNVCYKDAIVCPGGGLFNPSKDRCEISTSYSCNSPVKVASSGFDFISLKEHYVETNGVQHNTGRGWQVTVFDTSWAIEDTRVFDTYGDINNSNAMKDYINSIQINKYVALTTYDEPKSNVFNNVGLITAMKTLGVTESLIQNLDFRSAYAFIGIKKAVVGEKISEQYEPRYGSTIYINNFASGYQKIQENGNFICVRNIDCGIGTFSNDRNRCEVAPIYNCFGGSEYQFSHTLSSQTDHTCKIKDTVKICPDEAPLNANRGDDDRCERVIQDTECPTGYTWSSSLNHCTKSVVCPDGGTLNTTLDRCEIKVSDTNTCPNNSDWVQIAEGGNYLCVIDNSTTNLSKYCLNSGVYVSNMNNVSGTNIAVHSCTLDNTQRYCPDGSFAPDNNLRLCVDKPQCPTNSHYDNNYQRCVTTVSHTCPPSEYGYNWTYNETTFLCEASPMCPTGTGFNTTTNKCERDIQDVKDCPASYHWDKTLDHCVEDVICPANGQLNPDIDRCEYAINIDNSNCDIANGFAWNSSSSRCERKPFCANGGTYDDKNNVCYKPLDNLTCSDTGYSYSGVGITLNKCVKAPDCGSGAYNATDNTCVGEIKNKCDTTNGYSYNATSKQCERLPICVVGTVYNDSRNRCEQTKALSDNCPTGYTWSSSLNHCTKSVVCPDGGTLNTTLDRCEKAISGSNTCPFGDWEQLLESSVYICVIPTNKLSSHCLDSGVYYATFNGTSVHNCILNATNSGYSCLDTSYSPDTTNNKCTKIPECVGTDLGYDSTYKKCTDTAKHTCPTSGYADPYKYIYDSALQKCVMTPKCESPFTFDTTSHRCELKVTSSMCPSGLDLLGANYSYSFNGTECEKLVNCPDSGTFIGGSVDKCKKSAQATDCPVGYSPNGSICEVTNICPDGGTFSGAEGKCVLAKTEKDFCSSLVSYGIVSDRSKCTHEYTETLSTDINAACGSPIGANSGVALEKINNRCIYEPSAANITCDTAHGYYAEHLSDGSYWCVKSLSTTTISTSNPHSMNTTDNCPIFSIANASMSIQGGSIDKCIVAEISTCPSGYVLGAVDGNQGECQKIVSSADNCPIGYNYDPSTNKCGISGCDNNSTYDTASGKCIGGQTSYYDVALSSGDLRKSDYFITRVSKYQDYLYMIIDKTNRKVALAGVNDLNTFLGTVTTYGAVSELVVNRITYHLSPWANITDSGDIDRVISISNSAGYKPYGRPYYQTISGSITMQPGITITGVGGNIGNAYTKNFVSSFKFNNDLSFSYTIKDGNIVCINNDNSGAWGACAIGTITVDTEVTSSPNTDSTVFHTLYDGFGNINDFSYAGIGDSSLSIGSIYHSSRKVCRADFLFEKQENNYKNHQLNYDYFFIFSQTGAFEDRVTYTLPNSTNYGVIASVSGYPGSSIDGFSFKDIRYDGTQTVTTYNSVYNFYFSTYTYPTRWSPSRITFDANCRWTLSNPNGISAWSFAPMSSSDGSAYPNTNFDINVLNQKLAEENAAAVETVFYDDSLQPVKSRNRALLFRNWYEYPIGEYTIGEGFIQSLKDGNTNSLNDVSCSGGSVPSNGVCVVNPNCNGTSFLNVDTTKDKCYQTKTYQPSLSADWTLDSITHQYSADIICPFATSWEVFSSYGSQYAYPYKAAYSTFADACYDILDNSNINCDSTSGYSISPFSSYGNARCQKTPSCPSDSYNGQYWDNTNHNCKVSYTNPCGANYSDAVANGKCLKDWSCPSAVDNFSAAITPTSDYSLNKCYVDKISSCSSLSSIYSNLNADGSCYTANVSTLDTDNSTLGYADICPNGSFDANTDKCKAIGASSICQDSYTATFDGSDNNGDVCYKNGLCGVGISSSFIQNTTNRCEVDTKTDTCALSGYSVDYGATKSTIVHPLSSDNGTKNICYETSNPICSGSDSSRYFDVNINSGVCAENIQNSCNYASGSYSWDKSLLKCKAIPDCNSGGFDPSNDRCSQSINCIDKLYNGTDSTTSKCYTGLTSNGIGYIPDGTNIPTALSAYSYDACANGTYNGASGFKVCDAGSDVCDNSWTLDATVDKCYTAYSCSGNASFAELGSASNSDKCYENKTKVCERFLVDGRKYLYNTSKDRCEEATPYCAGSNTSIEWSAGTTDKCIETPTYVCDSANSYSHLTRPLAEYNNVSYHENRCEKTKDCKTGNFDDKSSVDTNPDSDICYKDRVISCDTANSYIPEYLSTGSFPNGADTNNYADVCKWTKNLTTLCATGGTYNGSNTFNVCDAGSNVCQEDRLYADFSKDKCIQDVSCGSDDLHGVWFNTVVDKCSHDTYSDVCNASTINSSSNFVLNWGTSASTTQTKTKNICYENTVPDCLGIDGSVKFDATLSATVDGTSYKGFCTENWSNDCTYGYVWTESLDKCILNPICPDGGQFDNANDRCKVAIGCSFSSSPALYNSLDSNGVDSKCYTGLTSNGAAYVPDGNNIPTALSAYSYDACTDGIYNGASGFKVCDAGSNVCQTSGLSIDINEDKCYKNIYCGANDSSSIASVYDGTTHLWDKNANECRSSATVNCQGGVGYNPQTGLLESCDISLNNAWCHEWTYEYSNSSNSLITEQCKVDTNCAGGTFNPTTNRCEYSTAETNCREDIGYVLNITTQECTIGDGSALTAICKDNTNLLGIDTTFDTHLNTQNDFNVSFVAESIVYSTLEHRCRSGVDTTTSRNIISNVCPSTSTTVENYYYFTQSRTEANGYLVKNKCEIVPICDNGIFNQENNSCYLDDLSCPIGTAGVNGDYECRGSYKNRWCSPFHCDGADGNTGQCGVGVCVNGLPNTSQTKYDFSPLNGQDTTSVCNSEKCDLVSFENIGRCGLDSKCPTAFGVYEVSGNCFKDICPQGSTIQDNGDGTFTCYELSCPTGTLEAADGSCVQQ